MRSFFSNQSTKVLACKKQQLLLYELCVRLQNGATVIMALEDIITQQNPSISLRLRGVLQLVKNGKNLSQAFRTANLLYPEIINMLVAGEKTHHLQQAIALSNALLDQIEKRSEIFRQAVSYPIFLLIVCLSSIAFATYLLLPQLKVIAQSNVDLPFSTHFFLFLISLSIYQWFGMMSMVALIIGMLFRFKRTYFFHRYLLRLGLLGKIILYQDLSCFCHHMSICMKIQLNIPQALKQSSDLFKNQALKRSSQQMITLVLQGHTLSDALKNHPHFPSIISQTVQNIRGQANLSECFANLAKHFEELSRRNMMKIQPFIEPILTLSVGLVIAFFIHAIILPLYDGANL